MDLGDSQALLEYNKAVLQIKFGLKIILPPGHLIPTVCLRSAFIQEVIKSEQKVLEVGTGSSAILAMIMGTMGCNVIATEANKENFLFAQQNIKRNNLERLVELRLCAPDEILFNVVKENETFDRIIAYPPQYSNNQPVRFHQAQRGFGGDELELIGGREGFDFSVRLVQELVESSVLASNGFLALLILNNELVKRLITELRNKKWSYQILEVIAGTRRRYIIKTSLSIEITNRRKEEESIFDNK